MSLSYLKTSSRYQLPTRVIPQQALTILDQTFQNVLWKSMALETGISDCHKTFMTSFCSTFAEDEHFTRYSSLFTCYSLLVTFYWLLVTFYSLLVTFYSLLRYSLLIRTVLYYNHNVYIKLYVSSWKRKYKP